MHVKKLTDVSGAASLASWRSSLVSGTAIAGLMMAVGATFSPWSVNPALAVAECGPVGPGNDDIACDDDAAAGGSIVYGNAQTSIADTTQFMFFGTQATGDNANSNGVFLSSDEDGHSITIYVQPGNNDPTFNGRPPIIVFGFPVPLTSGNANGFYAQTEGDNSNLTMTVNGIVGQHNFNGGATSGGPGGPSAAGLNLQTFGDNSSIDLVVTDINANGGLAGGLANVSGLINATEGDDSSIRFMMNSGTIDGGYAIVAVTANGYMATTQGQNASIDFILRDGSITGGGAGGASLVHGVSLETAGENASVRFTMEDGSIGSGTQGLLTLGHGVNISTQGTNAHVWFEATGGEILSESGNGVNIVTADGSIFAGDTINNSIYSSTMVGGLGVGTGFHAQAGGAGDADVHIGPDGSVGGTGAGVIAKTMGSGNAHVLIEGEAYQDVATALPGELLLPVAGAAVAFGTGNANIESTLGSDVSQIGAIPVAGVEGAGLLALTLGGGDAQATANGRVSATGIGVGAIAAFGGDATTTVNGNIAVYNANGGVSPLNLLGFDELGDGTVGGIAATTFGASTLNFGGEIIAYDDPGQYPDLGMVALSLGGMDFEHAKLNITPNPETGAPSIINANLVGAAAINLGAGDGVITETPFIDPITEQVYYNTTNAGAIGIAGLSMTGDVTITAGNVSTGSETFLGFSGGVLGVSLLGGDVDVTNVGKVSVDGGQFGVGALSIGGNATVNVLNDIDPPLVGAWTAAIGAGNAHTIVGPDVLVEADLVGATAIQLGTGNATVDIEADSIVDSAGIGIGTIKISGDGNTTINIAETAEVYGGVSAIDILHLSPDGPAEVNNYGLVQGEGFLGPVIAAATSSGLVINNYATGIIRGEETANGSPLGPFEPMVVSIGGATRINNDGSMYGNVTLLDFTGTGNVIDNTGIWVTGGFNTMLSGSGLDRIDNTGTIEANIFTVFAVDNINNAGGILTTQDDAIEDLTIVTGNFNGAPSLFGGSELAFDAALTPGGFADVLVVEQNVTGVTYVDVNDLDGSPGQYDPNGVLFALVGGNTDASNFITNGGIDKGLFRYDAYLRPVVGDYDEWVLASTFDREAYEFPVFAYGAQNLWYASTGTWLDRTADLRAGFTGPTTPPVVDLKNEGATVPMPSNVGPGLWGRVFGGHHERDLHNVSTPPEGLEGPSYTYDDVFRQRHLGMMAGADFAIDGNNPNEAWLIGFMAGYVQSDLDFRTSGTEADYKQGSIGAYATYLNGGSHADLVVKADFGKMKYSMNDGTYADRTDTKYRSVGVMLDAGYRFDQANGWFFEPKASLAYVHTSFDEMTVLGTGVQIDDAKSLRGRLGARVGGNFVSNGNIIEPYVELSVWNEFQGNHTTTFLSGGLTPSVNYDTGGVYGEGVVGASLLNTENGWSLYGKGTVKFGGDGLLAYSGNLGLRKSW